MRIAGVMTGTSCDGLDVACLEFRKEEWRTLWTRSARYPSELRERVLAVQQPNARLSLREFGELHRDLGAWYAATLQKMCATNQPDAIASHGQTVAHFPAAKHRGFTWQFGDPSRIAQATGLTVISNFRDGDMAAGGEGAPLAPRFHQLLARTIAPHGRIAIHNLGGISNVTYIRPGREPIAFDTGPGNIWIDAAAQIATGARWDRNGRLAKTFAPDLTALKALLKHPYFRRRPPKSTGRDDFPIELLLASSATRDGALVATATRVTIESIVDAYERWILPHGLEAVYFCGGGARNTFLLDSLRTRLAPLRVTTIDETGFDSKFLEAQAFAYFGFLALQGIPLGGAWTGVEGWAPSAHIIPGRNWKSIVRQLARAGS